MDTLSKEHSYYAMRLTPYPNNETKVLFCRERIGAFIEAIGGKEYLFGQEYEKNFHFHIVFSHLEEFSTNKGEKITEIKRILYDLFEVPKEKYGNPTYSLESVRSLEKAFSYAVKDGNYEASAEWIQIAEEAYENSHEKTHSLRSSLGSLTDKFIKDEITDKDLWIGLGQSRANLGLPLSIRWIDEMLLSIQCKKNPELLESLWILRENK